MKELQSTVLEFYRQPGIMSSAGKYAGTLKNLPDSVDDLVNIIQGLMIYDAVALDFYGHVIPESRKDEIHIRPVEKMLDRIFALDGHSLSTRRSIEKRLVSRCNHFVLLLVAILRIKGVPARARSGFGVYFNPGYFEDHWVCEYWNAEQECWMLVDPQFDKIWKEKLHIQHNILNVPRDQFLIAAKAWEYCRKGEKDPSKFGIYFTRMYGLWFIAGSLIRDIASLNKMEMLPWDIWGAQPTADQQLNDGQLTFFDQLAVIGKDPDKTFDELRKLYQNDDQLLVPDKVFNSLLNHVETT
jgi:hypothetical protein